MVATGVVDAEQDLTEARQAGERLSAWAGNEEMPKTITGKAALAALAQGY